MRPASLEKFKQIYQQVYGIRLKEQEAYDLATNLVNLYRTVYLDESHKNISPNYEKKSQPSQAQK